MSGIKIASPDPKPPKKDLNALQVFVFLPTLSLPDCLLFLS